jgi:molybdate transport system regulatory protein
LRWRLAAAVSGARYNLRMAKARAVHVRIRVDFDSGTSLGPGKVALLQQIHACGSLSQAARVLGLSYRRAWLLLDDINHSFDEPVVVTATGGNHGGGAKLTSFGHELIERYRELEQIAEKQAVRSFGRIASGIANDRTGLKRPLPTVARRKR